MENKTSRLTLAAYFCWTLGITAAVYLAVDTKKNNLLTGISLALIVLGIILTIVKDRSKVQ